MIMRNPHMLLDVEKKYKNVISDEGKKKLKHVKYEENICNPCCPIYYIDFKVGDEITILPCNHGFCSEAITQWLSNEKAECPVCRLEIDSIEVKIEQDNLFINEDEDMGIDQERITIHDNSPIENSS